MKRFGFVLAAVAALSVAAAAQAQDGKDSGSIVIQTLTVAVPSTQVSFPHGGTVLMMINTIGTVVVFRGNLVNASLKDPGRRADGGGRERNHHHDA